MTLSTPLAAIAMTVCLAPNDPRSPNPPAPDLPGRWTEAFSMQFFATAGGFRGKLPESAAMIGGIVTGKMGPGQAWFTPGQSRLGWSWLAERMDADHDGKISRAEFCGSDEFFTRLDRDGDGVLTAADFDWSPKPPKAVSKEAPPKEVPSKEAKEKEAKGGGGMPPSELLMEALFRGELGSPYEGPRVGRRAPLFTLPTHDGKQVIALEDHLRRKPVVLIFGSFT